MNCLNVIFNASRLVYSWVEFFKLKSKRIEAIIKHRFVII